MTSYTGVNIRVGEAYWELSGPLPMNRMVSCRACKDQIQKGEQVMVRDGRKLRFFYHVKCFTGNADPRSQDGNQFQDKQCIYHQETAPNVSGLKKIDPDGREFGRKVFKQEAPKVLGYGKWSVTSRGYQPNQILQQEISIKK